MNLKEIQDKELGILKHVISILNENKLSYYMLGGTLLGAIRHKDFIPWDDDIDIGIPREDYHKFIELFTDNNHDHFQLRHFKLDGDYRKYFVKIEDTRYPLERNDTLYKEQVYTWIDIFPLDGMPGDLILRKYHQMRLLFRRLLLQYSNIRIAVNIKKKRKLLENLLLRIGLLFQNIWRIDARKQLDVIDRLLMKYPYETSPFVVNFMGAYKFKEMFPKEYYGEGAAYKFNELTLPGPKEYHKVLTQMYGNYMTPPPLDERFSHSITATGPDNE